MNKEMVDSHSEKSKPRILWQAQVNKIHKDLHCVFNTIFQVKLFKHSPYLMFLTAHNLTGYEFVKRGPDVFELSKIKFMWPIETDLVSNQRSV